MSRMGPLLTLLGGAALAVVLLVASINAVPSGDDPPGGDLISGQGAETPSVAPTPSVVPTVSPTPPDGLGQDDPGQDEADEEPVSYVGDVDGRGASVAIVINGDEATAYVCDGDTVEAWLEGSAVDGELRLTGDDAELTGTFDAAEASGETTVAGQTFTFTIPFVEGDEGLYRFASTIVGGAEVEGGWIVLPDGRQVGIVTVDGQPRRAPELDTWTGLVILEGTRVTADKVG